MQMDETSIEEPKKLISFDQMKKFNHTLLCFLDDDDKIEENFQIILDIFDNLELSNNNQSLTLILTLILRIANNHARKSNFFTKIERILQIFKKDIKKSLSNSDIFNIFSSNKRILLFLIQNNFLVFDHYICEQIITEQFVKYKYPQYFSPEMRNFIDEEWFAQNAKNHYLIKEIEKELPLNFEENRHIGENNSYICKLIQNDSIKEFQTYVVSEGISSNHEINLSIYETNNFLIKASLSRGIHIIDYAAFFGSTQIVQFLYSNGAKLTPNIWIYAIHSNNPEMIHFLEDNEIVPEDKTYQECFIESIKCHHTDMALYFNSIYTEKKDDFTDDVLIQIFKYFNYNFMNEESNKLFNIFDFLDFNEIFDIQIQVKRKRGRPKTKSDDSKTNKKRKKTKKRADNYKMMQQLDNPQMVSVAKKPFLISIPLKGKLDQDTIDSLYAKSQETSINWKNVNIEEVFDDVHLEKESSIGFINDQIEEEEDNDDDDENVTRENIESEYAPFENEIIAYSYACKANKGYRLKNIATKNPHQICFICSSSGCNYRVEFIKNSDGFHLSYQSDHTCSHPLIIDTKKIQEVVFNKGKREKLNDSYMAEINAAFNLPPNSINKLRIRRAYNTVFELNRNDRLASWGKLQNFIDIIKRSGGKGAIHKNKNGEIDFVGIVPNYAICFISSALFFPVVQCDTRFQTGISKGHLYTMVTLTGNRSILPLAMAWAPTEGSAYTDMFLDLLSNELHFIKSCLTDESPALIGSIERVNINSLLCFWHLCIHCPIGSKSAFVALVKSQTSKEYFQKKEDIIQSDENLKNFLDKKSSNNISRWIKISRFESEAQRDLNISTTAVESFNATIKRLNLKKKEPLEVFHAIYDIGFFVLKDICLQNGMLTDTAFEWLSYALAVSNHLTVTQSSISQFKYLVTKENDRSTELTVIICPSEEPICSCKFFHDCGMPCVHMIAVALKYKIDWTAWIHPRYFVVNYRFRFQNSILYPDFDSLVKTNDDIPVNISSLMQRQKRIGT